ncbi:MAG: response regulator [Acidobacteriota bacterium]
MTKTILLADDSMTIQKVVELTFMDQDYQVVAVSDGTSAIDKISEIHPDLVIADVHMPGADGYEVCRQTKALRPDTPVLLLVGTFEQFDEQTARESGADGDLKKPFDSQELLGQVESLISSAAPAPAPAPAPSFAEPAPQPVAPQPAAPEPAASEPGPPADSLEPSLAITAEIPTLAQEPPLEAEADPLEFEASPEEAEEPAISEEIATFEEQVLETSVLEAQALETSVLDAAAAADPLETEEAPMLEAPTLEPLESASAEAEEASVQDDGESDVDGTAATQPMAARQPASGDAEHAGSNGTLSDEDVERIARRVAEILGEKAIEEVVWEVVPDLAEVVIKNRIRELESQVESA